MSETVPIVLQGRLLGEAGFRHLFSTRRGGVSPVPFDTMNFGDAAGASERSENLARLRPFGVEGAQLYETTQVHGGDVLEACGPVRAFRAVKADALVARHPGLAVGVRVADCVPILVGDRRTGHVAAIHAGWRGVVAGVVGNALGLLTRDASSCVAAIGPSIGACCFEVSSDVASLIAASAPAAIVAERAQKAMVDLRLAVRSQLLFHGLGASSIEDVPGCTRCDGGSFYSYRRDGDKSGRLLAAITAPLSLGSR